MLRYLGIANGALVVLYLALIATAMAYAALQVEFSYSIKTDEAQVATLETRYLAAVSSLTTTDVALEGYTAPVATVFVPGAPQTALNTR